MTGLFGALKRLVAAGKQLAVCGECGSDTVVPVRWRTDDATHWWIRVRCGECGAVREQIVRDEDAHAFERRLHRTAQPIRRNLALLDRLGMQRDAELLAAALERDLIDAADFR